jgi:hypothetical protein
VATGRGAVYCLLKRTFVDRDRRSSRSLSSN